MSEHPSRLTLDALRLGELGDDEAAAIREHVHACELCAGILSEADGQDAWFLEQFPSSMDLETAVAPSLARPDSHREHDQAPPAPPLRYAWWAIGAGIAAAAAVMLFTLPPELSSPSEPQPQLHASNLRPKGASALDITVRRGAERFRLDQQRLHPGDLLTFRYTSSRTHLTIVGTEERTGKVSVYLAQAIAPGADVGLKEAVRLDDYLGRETLVAYFTDAPLDTSRFTAPPAEGARGTPVDGVDAETVSITFTKVRR